MERVCACAHGRNTSPSFSLLMVQPFETTMIEMLIEGELGASVACTLHIDQNAVTAAAHFLFVPSDSIKWITIVYQRIAINFDDYFNSN